MCGVGHSPQVTFEAIGQIKKLLMIQAPKSPGSSNQFFLIWLTASKVTGEGLLNTTSFYSSKVCIILISPPTGKILQL